MLIPTTDVLSSPTTQRGQPQRRVAGIQPEPSPPSCDRSGSSASPNDGSAGHVPPGDGCGQGWGDGGGQAEVAKRLTW